MTIEYTYYGSGDWKAACTYCGTYIITKSIAEAQKKARSHAKVCGQ